MSARRNAVICGIEVREWDRVRVTGVDSNGYAHTTMTGTVATSDGDDPDDDAIKVWPDDADAGDGSGKVWLRNERVERIELLEAEDST